MSDYRWMTPITVSTVFLADQCRHDHTPTIMSLSCLDHKVENLCYYWTPAVLYLLHENHNVQDSPSHLQCLGLHVSYTILGIVRLFHQTNKHSVVKMKCQNRSTHEKSLNCYDVKSGPTLRRITNSATIDLGHSQ